jgi:hypothetical protein
MNPTKNQIGKIGTVFLLASVGVTLYWGFTYSGPYRYLAELQLKWFGIYYQEITAIVIILGFLGIAGVIKLVFRGAERPVPGAAGATPLVAARTVTNTPKGTWVSYLRYAFLLMPFGLGGWAYYNGTHAGNLQQLDAVDFESGKLQVQIVYADVRGHVGGPYLSQDNYLYIPMSSEKSKVGPVQLVVGVDKNQMHNYLHRDTDGRFIVRGVVDKGLEGDVKYAFEKNGFTVAEPCWVLHAGREPSSDKLFGMAMIGLGIAFTAGVLGLESYRKKKRAAARPLPATA